MVRVSQETERKFEKTYSSPLVEVYINLDMYLDDVDDEENPMVQDMINDKTIENVIPDEIEAYDEGEYVEEEEIIKIKSCTYTIKATIIDYWCELSYQYVELPHTPAGSYSHKIIHFRAYNNSSTSECVCGYLKKKKAPNFQCHFQVYGGCEEITVEPICGDLKYGESIKIMLIARPTIENHLLQEQAKINKIKKMLADVPKKKGAPAKSKKTEPEPKPIRLEDYPNLVLESSDFYPAEKELWRNICEYDIKTVFTFHVTFDPQFNKKPEFLYLSVKCHVVRPTFITNAETQLLNFGPTAIGTRPRKILEVENISRKIISPELSLVCPTGPFSCNMQEGITLDTEYILKIPIKFTPTKLGDTLEYFEVKYGHTIASLALTGVGIIPELDFTPKFSVGRIEAKFGGKADLTFQVINKCEAPLVITVVNTLELKGSVIPKPVEKVEKVKGKDDKKDKKDKKSKDDKSSKKSDKSAKPKKFSDTVTPDEEYSIQNSFQLYGGDSQFTVLNATEAGFTVLPNSKMAIKIRFEEPKDPNEVQTKGKKDKKGKPASKASSSVSSKTSSSKSKNKDKESTYISKFNVMLGHIKLVKEFVIIAKYA